MKRSGGEKFPKNPRTEIRMDPLNKLLTSSLEASPPLLPFPRPSPNRSTFDSQMIERNRFINCRSSIFMISQSGEGGGKGPSPGGGSLSIAADVEILFWNRVSYHFYVRKARFPRRLYNATSLTRPPLHFLLQQATRSAESIRSQPRRNPYKVSLHRVSSVRPSVVRLFTLFFLVPSPSPTLPSLFLLPPPLPLPQLVQSRHD